jgi:hypothetical protein
MVIDTPARHRMEYIYGFIVNKIIKDFKGITFPVKTDKQVSVPVSSFIKPTVISGGVKSPSNVILGYIVLKGGGTEFNDHIHYTPYPPYIQEDLLIPPDRQQSLPPYI